MNSLAPLAAADFSAAIGRVSSVDDCVSAQLTDRFRACLGTFLAPTEGPQAPAGVHWCLAADVPTMDELREDGHRARGGFLPPIPLPRRMWAGGEIEFFQALNVDERFSRRSQVVDVSVKAGRTGTLWFVTVQHEYIGDRGVAIRERQDIVYREAAVEGGTPPKPSASPQAVPSPAAVDASWTVHPSETLLFRYSALTFNSHRIHYDRAYATSVEHYADLVVHGPLQATLLLNMATTSAGRLPRRFSYRGVSPLTAEAAFTVEATLATDSSLHCVTRNAQGRVAMESVAQW